MPNIVLKDRIGDDITYNNVQQIVVKDDTGNLIYYSLGGGGIGVVTVLTLNNYNDDHNTALATVTNPSLGDMAIIRAPITDQSTTDELYEYTAYIYKEEQNGNYWQAMDGNYSANNVFFNDNIRATTTVGYISSGSIPCKGKNVNWLMEKMLKKIIQPSKTNPSASVSMSSGSGEVGASFTPSWSASFSPGSFTYGPTTGCKSTAATLTFSNGTTKTDAANWTSDSGTLSSGVYTDAEQSFTVQLTSYGWTASTGVAVDNIGEPANPPVIIAAASGQQSAVATGKFTGFRKYFYGGLASEPTYDSAHMRQLTNSSGAVGTSQFTMSVAAGSKFVVIAVLKSAGKVIDYVKDHGAFDTDIADRFVKRAAAVQIGGVNNTNPVDYDVYVYDTNGTPLSASEYYVKFKNA